MNSVRTGEFPWNPQRPPGGGLIVHASSPDLITPWKLTTGRPGGFDDPRIPATCTPAPRPGVEIRRSITTSAFFRFPAMQGILGEFSRHDFQATGDRVPVLVIGAGRGQGLMSLGEIARAIAEISGALLGHGIFYQFPEVE